jgi:hypothetical protein
MAHVGDQIVGVSRPGRQRELTIRGSGDHGLRRELILLIRAPGSADPGGIVVLDISTTRSGRRDRPSGRFLQTEHHLEKYESFKIDANAVGRES